VRYNLNLDQPLPVATMQLPDDMHLVPVTDVPFSALSDFDTEMFGGVSRQAFLQAWISQPGTHGVAAIRGSDPSLVCGFGCVRPCLKGFKIGPLFADSPAIADALFRELVKHAHTFVYLDIPLPNQEAVRLIERYSMNPVFETGRMYRKGRRAPPKSLPLDKIFGITSFELG